jgi:hypothetical protein
MLHVMSGEALVHPRVTVPVVPTVPFSTNPNTALLPGVVFTVEGLPGASPIVTGEFPLLNVAVTVWAAVIVTEHPPVPVQPAPLQPANVDPSAAAAVSATTAPLAKLAEHVVGQLIPAGALDTTPVPVPASFTARVKLFALCAKLATTVVAAVIVSVQVPVPSQGPAPHPVNVDPLAGAAVNVITVPLAKPNEHVAPQLIPAGLLVTVPVPFPPGVIVSVTLALVVITVESEAAGGATDPPPETPALFTCGELALLATFTVTVIPG